LTKNQTLERRRGTKLSLKLSFGRLTTVLAREFVHRRIMGGEAHDRRRGSQRDPLKKGPASGEGVTRKAVDLGRGDRVVMSKTGNRDRLSKEMQ